MSFMDIEETLAAHNRYRAAHGAPPLQWSDECAEYAQRCAVENHDNGRMRHCMTSTDDGKRMGQNIYWCSMPNTATAAVKAWYDEVTDPGYDFNNPGFGHGTGHFTQVVWRGSTHVGMACGPAGEYIVANYYPPGNYMGRFEQNVFPADTPVKASEPVDEPGTRLVGFVEFDQNEDGHLDLQEFLNLCASQPPPTFSIDKARALFEAADKDADGKLSYNEFVALVDSGALVAKNESGGPQTYDAWSDELEAMMSDVPFTQYVDALKNHLQSGGTAEVNKTANSVSIKLISPGGWSSMSGSWG